MKFELSSGEIKLLIDLLDRAGDQFGQHGCNDYSLSEYGGLTDEESHEVFASMHDVFSKDMEGWKFEDQQMDWFLLAFLRERIKGQVK